MPPIKTLSLVFTLLAQQAFALDTVNSTYFGNFAVEGYNTVAYFTENRHIKSNKH